MKDIDLEWEEFLENDDLEDYNNDNNNSNSNNNNNNNNNNFKNINNITNNITNNIPKASSIYISTKTKIAYLDQAINLQKLFWLLPIIDYHIPKEGIIKKQIKINSTSKEELDIIEEKLEKEIYVDQYIINHIDNPSGRIKYKDVRKISIGICKKDILSYRSKKKSAFYNCFVLMLRIFYKNSYKEIHVKVFNTGKLEIPGIQCEDLLYKVLKFLVELINSTVDYKDKTIDFIENKNETVLVNSNFNCGFYIDREKLFNILRFKYRINSCYDPCSYPGIQCEFYYNKNISKDDQTGIQPESNINNKIDDKCKIKDNNFQEKNIIKISFMIFRTGSILIVGKCNDDILHCIYEFIKNLLQTEFHEIVIKIE